MSVTSVFEEQTFIFTSVLFITFSFYIDICRMFQIILLLSIIIKIVNCSGGGYIVWSPKFSSIEQHR